VQYNSEIRNRFELLISYCINPQCSVPGNPQNVNFCQNCGTKLKLRDRYHAIKLIGQGGFGKTYLAIDEDKPSKPPCVIKQFMPPDPQSLKKAEQLFEQEAAYLETLGQHPQIPELLAHFQEGDRLYLVQEYINGDDLAKELQQLGVFTETKIIELLTGLLPVIKFLHDRQLIHRDIKPANIIRTREGNSLVLVDFGAVKSLTNSSATIIGSPEFMAPEQAIGKALPASDLYNLGVTCIHLLTQISPFDLRDPLNDCWAWRSALPFGNIVSDRLAQILDKLIQNAVNKRYQTAQSVLNDLDALPVAVTTTAPTSQSGIDYDRLWDLLAAGKWREADRETWNLLCQIAGKEVGSYLYESDIAKLNCEDLLNLDSMWMTHSHGKFGFKLKVEIYNQVGQDYKHYCDRIGWRQKTRQSRPYWIEYDQVNFTNTAPSGHLPWIIGFYGNTGACGQEAIVRALKAKFTSCEK
jgi:serine/threonine protein kinase